MFSKQAMLAAIAVAGFAFGVPLAGRVLGTVGLSGVPPTAVAAVASGGAFLIAKRLLR